jgi:hypothetical protein
LSVRFPPLSAGKPDSQSDGHFIFTLIAKRIPIPRLKPFIGALAVPVSQKTATPSAMIMKIGTNTRLIFMAAFLEGFVSEADAEWPQIRPTR